MVERQSRAVCPCRRLCPRRCPCFAGDFGDGRMKFALINPNWDFSGSTYFGCQHPHYPLELLFAYDKILEGGHDPRLIDAQNDSLNTTEVQRRLTAFRPDF